MVAADSQLHPAPEGRGDVEGLSDVLQPGGPAGLEELSTKPALDRHGDQALEQEQAEEDAEGGVELDQGVGGVGRRAWV